jgi:hypothetical protein
MKVLFLSVLLSAIAASCGLAANANYAAAPVDQLIEDLMLVDAPAPGIDGMTLQSAFLAEEKAPQFNSGVLGAQPPTIPPQMRELVRRGLASLPALIRHLDDKRLTRLVVGGDISFGSERPENTGRFVFMFQYFSDEYDARNRPAKRTFCSPPCRESYFHGTYTVRVGDVCYALVGQIVNRNLIPVHYQPTAGLVVNSPIETPTLIERVTADWHGLDAQGHETSLLADIRTADIRSFDPAFARLRFYYPDAYRALSDEDRKKRDAFEAHEKAVETPR